MNNINRQKRLERAQIRVMFQAPFFAPGVARLPVVFDESVPTACTNGKEIRFGTAFFDRCKDHELVTVLCHEVCHPMLGHLWRFQNQDSDVANISCDHAVNLMLKEFSALVTATGKADPFPFPDPQDAYCADPRFKGMSEEQIYRELMNQPKSGGGNGARQAGHGAKQVGSNVQSTPSGGKTPVRASNAQSGASGKPHSMPSFGQFEPQKQGPEGKKEAADWQNTLIQAVQMARGQGNLPAGLARMVDELVNPKVPWSQILRNWLREQCSDDWSWGHPDLTMEGSGFILPTLRSEKMGPVIFATDTSGSINDKLLSEFRSEKQGCLDEMRPSALLDIYCDAKVHKATEYQPGETIGREAPGGGGTSFVPVFEHVASLPKAPKCLVYLTDLAGAFPDEAPGYPVIWCTWEKSGKAPFGQIVYVGD